MIRAAGLVALAAALFCAPVAAQDAEPDGGLRGVWQGTVGDLAIHACFGGEDEPGVYYYDRHRKLIRLLNEEGQFFEAEGYNEPTDNFFRFREISNGRASGEWSDGSRMLPVNLQALEWSTRDGFGGPCESGAFMEPRLVGGSMSGISGELAGQEYVTLTYVPPTQWQGGDDEGSRDVNITSFILSAEPSDVHRTSRDINGQLTAHMPRGDMSDAYAHCFVSNIAAFGQDGYFMQELIPELITPRWVGALESNSVYCGGAHPSHWQTRRVFDRNSGKEIEPERWLNDSALERTLYESGVDSFVSGTMTQAFVTAVVAHWSADEESSECARLARQTLRWTIGLQAEGLALIPSMPHVYTACADTVVLPWADAAPFLSLEGQAVRLSIESTAQ